VKLVITIPALNEEQTLPKTLADLPKTVHGFDQVEWLLVDDGSEDRTSQVAREAGVQHIVRHPQRRGLAEAFSTALDAALRIGADVIVNTDADNQYSASSIEELVRPIVAGRADIVVGQRVGRGVAAFSRSKKTLQRLGSAVVRTASATQIPDTTSGFRAYSREAALRLNVLGQYTYTLESLIQAGRSGLSVISLPVETNPATRRSRLFSSTPEYVVRSAAQIIRAYAMYEPLRTFLYLAAVAFIGGSTIFVRFFVYFVSGNGTGHVQSLILGAVLMMVAFQLTVLGILADLLAANRKLLERVLFRIRSAEALQEQADLQLTSNPRP